jgi:hypothetical protein
LAESVSLLLDRYFPGDLVEAVMGDDTEGYDRLVAVCATACAVFSGGDTAAISVLFAEVSERLTDTMVDRILDSPDGPAATLAVVFHQHIETAWRRF